MICSFVISGESILKELVSDEEAACAAGVICLFVHYCSLSGLPFIATCFQGFHESVFTHISECLNTFVSIALSTFAPLVCSCWFFVILSTILKRMKTVNSIKRFSLKMSYYTLISQDVIFG